MLTVFITESHVQVEDGSESTVYNTGAGEFTIKLPKMNKGRETVKSGFV